MEAKELERDLKQAENFLKEAISFEIEEPKLELSQKSLEYSRKIIRSLSRPAEAEEYWIGLPEISLFVLSIGMVLVASMAFIVYFIKKSQLRVR